MAMLRRNTAAKSGLMPLVAGLAVALLASNCTAPPPPAGGSAAAGSSGESAANAERDSRAVIVAHETMLEAFEAGDVEGFAALLEPSAELLIFDPVGAGRFAGIEETRRGLRTMFASLGEASWSSFHPIVIVHGDVAWVTSHVLLESPRLEEPFVGRGTEIWVRHGETWRLVHGHWSEDPSRRDDGGDVDEAT
jgi:ketosteroid isomerase-like protein